VATSSRGAVAPERPRAARHVPFAYSFHRQPVSYVLLRASGAVRLVSWSHAMRHVIADPAFSERMPVVLAMTDAVEAAEASETAHIAQVWRLLVPWKRISWKKDPRCDLKGHANHWTPQESLGPDR
jgi:hypothetical protein